MKNRIAILFLVMVGLLIPAVAQNSQLPLPSPVEKELAAKASNVTEVTLGKNMLAFAAKFLNGKDGDQATTRHLIEGLDGIYVRDYEFDKDGQYSMVDVDKLRQYFETAEWSPIVREHDKRSGETTDVMVKLVNGETHGMFILSAEPKELSIVLILGPVKMEDLHKLSGLGGLGSLGDIDTGSHGKNKDKFDKDKSKKDGDE
ncbi:DUF4252 domain-containing protein [Telmatobacter sp. DSM 110680]|uniref:DUF4252 domain-containing protein n=1 Tax=Telmatobacter sp. DSM 110680 TaxID=3036704 RepID=A0AAU7DLS9_9BACT